MSEQSGDTIPVTSFHDLPDTAWSEPVAEAASPAVETAQSEPAAEPSPEAVTAPPADQTQSAATPDEPQGPIPFERHKEILNAAYKERDDYKTRAERVAWADELASAGQTPEQIRDALAVFDSVNADPVGYLERLYGVLQNNPQTASQARSWAGKILASRQAETQADAEPQPDFHTPDGAKFYSQEQQAKWMAWRERQLEQRIQQRYQPLEELAQRTQAAERERAEYERAAASAKGEFDAFKDRPHFAEHKADILAFMQQHNWQRPLADAYAHVLETKVIPKLTETGKAQAIQDFQKQAAASTTKPSVAAPMTPVAPKSFMDPSLKWD